MVKTLKRPGLPLLPCCSSGLRSTSMEQKVWRLMGQDAHCLPKMSQVWIQLVTFFECHILDAFNLSGHCAVVFVSKAHMSLKCFHAGYTQYLSTTLKLQVWVFVRLIVKKFQRECGAFEHMIWWQIISDIRSSDIGQEIWRRFILVPGWFAQWKLDGSELKGTKSHVLIYSRNRCGIRKGRNKSVVWILPGSFTHRLWHRAFGSRNSINQKNCRTQHSKADSSKGG